VAVLVAALTIAIFGAQPASQRAAAERSVNVIVQKLNPFDDAPERAVVEHGGRVTHTLPIVDGFSAELPASAVDDLRATPGVRSVTEDLPVHFEGQYGVGSGVASAAYTDIVRASDTWAGGYTGAGVGVAIIDTGINSTGDLAGKVVHAEDFSGDLDNIDYYGHGTFLGGLVAGSGAASGGSIKGVAPGANLISLKIAGRDGSADITHVLAALQWAVSFKDVYNIRVVNLSLGTDSSQDYRIDPFDAAVERAWQYGLVVVVSTGNNGPGAGTINKPADDPFVVTVGAIDDRTTPGRGDDVVPSYTGQGPTAANGLVKPDLVAPGTHVISSRAAGSFADTNFPAARVLSDYFKGSGTSFATPMVSAAAALALQRSPGLNPNQVKQRLTSTATRGPSSDPNLVGHGVLDAYAATMSNDLSEANGGVQLSDGTGSLQASRGSLSIQIQTGTVVDVLGNVIPVYSQVVGLLTGQNTPFDAVQYFSTDWTTSHWYTSHWYTSHWYTSHWYTSHWYTSHWYASDWS
jgi:serine protease AprX